MDLTLSWQAPPPESFDALLVGSANALRHAGPALAAYQGKPSYAVGTTTADAARAAGLDVVVTGSGGLAAVLAEVYPEHRRLLRLTGRERTALPTRPGVTIDERVVYASNPLPMQSALEAMTRQPAVVLLHSAEAARHFAGLGLPRAELSLATLGPRIADAAGDGWRAVGIAARPDETALLALTRQMCEDARG